MKKLNYLSIIPVSESSLELFEKKIEVRLPQEYRDFLLDQGGGVLADDYIFKMSKPGTSTNSTMLLEDSIEYLSAFDSENSFDLNTHYHYMNSEQREFPYIPDELIVIGGAGNSYLLLGIKGEPRGKVFFWHSNLFHGDENGQESYENISYVSDNFEKFINELTVEEAV